ncbi:acetyltransferase [Kribbella orskensis]|uniref:Acetyltransferase n=1 Tax=Kribbella orskensis TaxID=2512216 RepID=A0ABY2BGB6_9ACTN|nr:MULTISPECIES: acetate--CoA ligase [Kribbella]TCN37924.1 acetyltransferase [Kribbella sp. VKM Ac-2500]TCO19410.1 acetyltransferase [Kribbella orskensis]
MPVLRDGLTAVFEPRRVALVGASDQPGKTGEVFWRNLSSFPGEIVPVTSSAGAVGGQKAYPTLTAVEGDIDLAVIVVPAAAVPAVIRDAGAKGVSAAIVISGGFAEAGPEGIRLHYQLMTAAHAGGVRIVGPNCFGVQNCDLPLNASLAAGTPRGGGGISLVTQSGAYGMAIHSLGLDEQIRFAKVYAAGNKADIGDAELLRYLADDPASRTLCFFLESLPDGRAFFEAARRVTPRKPVIVAKTGRSVAGVRAAWSHTAGLAGSERVWRAAFEQAGVILAHSGLEMMDVARALDAQPPPAGRRVAVITNSGGTGVELADLLADEGLEVPELSAMVQDELRPLLPPFASPSNPVDITPVWSRFAELYPLLVDRLARSGEVDAVVPVLLHRSASDERVAAGVRNAVARLRADGVLVPVYVCWVAPRASRPNADLLQSGGVPCFEWPERTARALGHAARYGEARARVRWSVQAKARARTRLPPGWLDAVAGAQVLADAGIPLVAGKTCTNADEARAAAEDLGYPVVAKVLHPAIVHKTEAGGIRTGLRDGQAVQMAATELLALAPGAAVLVQRQATGIEVVMGGLRDPQFGPVVVVGLGGIFVEVIDDVALCLAPIDDEDARHLLSDLRGYPLLTGTRGTRPVDLDALAAVIRAVGDLLVAAPEIAELDLNPVLATDGGCVAVDWRILVENPPAQDEERVGFSPRHAGESALRPS